MSVRKYNAKIICPQCGYKHVAESALSQWFRENLLQDGLNISDIDYTLHRYKIHGTRESHYTINLEVKIYGGELKKTQQETLQHYHEFMRSFNHRGRLAGGRFSGDGGVEKTRRVRSKLSGKFVEVTHLGIHLLQLSGDNPDNSEIILWNFRPVDRETLIKLLNIDIYPDTFRVNNGRRRKRNKQHVSQKSFEFGGPAEDF